MRIVLCLIVAVLAVSPALAQPGPAALPTDRPATLPELRAALGTPTVLRIEIDYMVEYNADGTVNHSHRPTAAEVDAVVKMFACQGITLTIVVDDEIPHRNLLRRDPMYPNNFFGYRNGPNTFGGIKDEHFDRGSGWHYGVFAHTYQDTDYGTSHSSGLAERPGDDFVVTLGSFANQVGTSWDRASTLAHEFGHNLGLRHTGASDLVGNHIMNLPSVMSYFYQLQGVRTALQCQGLAAASDEETLFKQLDYSHGRACTLVETILSEDRGMGIVPVDWNCDGNTGGIVIQNLNGDENGAGWCGSTGPLQTLSDYDEWSNLVDVSALSGDAYVSEDEACVTADQMSAFRARLDTHAARLGEAGGCNQPTPSIETCRSRRMHYLRPGMTLPLGTCRAPYRTLSEVQSLVGSGDILYVQPGTYPTSGVVLSTPMQVLGPGGAVFGD